MFCPECGCFLPEGTKTCKECGHRIKSAERGMVVEEQPLEGRCRKSISPRARSMIIENALFLAAVALVLCSLLVTWLGDEVTGADILMDSSIASSDNSLFAYTPIIVTICMILSLVMFFLGRRPYLLVTGAVALFCMVIFAVNGHYSGPGVILSVIGCLIITMIGLRHIEVA